MPALPTTRALQQATEDGGRLPDATKARMSARAVAHMSLEGVYQLAHGAKNEMVRLMAHREILDRAYGKPYRAPAPIEKDDDHAPPLTEMSDEELAALKVLADAQRRRREAAGAAARARDGAIDVDTKGKP